MAIPPPCSVASCTRAAIRDGLCDPHGKRKRAYGVTADEFPIAMSSRGFCCFTACEERTEHNSSWCPDHLAAWYRTIRPNLKTTRVGTVGKPGPPRAKKVPRAERTCLVDGCSSGVYAKDLCTSHYQRKLRSGDTTAQLASTSSRKKQPDKCIIDGCSAVPRSRSLCSKHYQRLINHGDPNAPIRDRSQRVANAAPTKNTPPTTAPTPSDEDKGYCRVWNCGRAAHSRGWCSTHYQRWYNTGDPERLISDGPVPKCAHESCMRTAVIRDSCVMHYQSWWDGAVLCEVGGCFDFKEVRDVCRTHYTSFWLQAMKPAVVTAMKSPAPTTTKSGSVCSKPNCAREATTAGLCSSHYKKSKEEDPTRERCKAKDCDKGYVSGVYCWSHYLKANTALKQGKPVPFALRDANGTATAVTRPNVVPFTSRTKPTAASTLVSTPKPVSAPVVVDDKPAPVAPPETTLACSVSGCGDALFQFGYCATHYARTVAFGHPTADPKSVSPTTTPEKAVVPVASPDDEFYDEEDGIPCAVAGCVQDAYEGELCTIHQARLDKHGDVNWTPVSANG